MNIFKTSAKKVFYLVTSLLIISCNTRKVSLYRSGESKIDECILDLNTGINDIELGISTFREIKEKFGEGIESEEKFKSFEVENFFPKIKYTISYPNLGLSFTTRSQDKWKSKKVVNTVILSSESVCKTKEEGVGIGSNFYDLEKLLEEEIKLTHFTYSGEYYTKTSSSSLENPEIYFIFECRGKKTPSEFIVEKIFMRRYY